MIVGEAFLGEVRACHSDLSYNNGLLAQGGEYVDHKIAPVVIYCKTEAESWGHLEQELVGIPSMVAHIKDIQSQVNSICETLTAMENFLVEDGSREADREFQDFKETELGTTWKLMQSRNEEVAALRGQVEQKRRQEIEELQWRSQQEQV